MKRFARFRLRWELDKRAWVYEIGVAAGAGVVGAAMNRILKRAEKRRTCEHISALITNWICDGCPSVDEHGEASREEAERIIRLLDRRIRSFQPNGVLTVSGEQKGTNDHK